MQDFSLKSVELLACGQELLELDQRISPFLKEEIDNEKFNEFISMYLNMLQKYSVRHNKLDFYIARFELPEYYKPQWLNAIVIVLLCILS